MCITLSEIVLSLDTFGECDRAHKLLLFRTYTFGCFPLEDMLKILGCFLRGTLLCRAWAVIFLVG